MKKFIPHRDAVRLNLGFSLVEVALAVAIAALGIITCLGLLPEGLEMSRRTAELTMQSNILEQIIRDIEKAAWVDIAGGPARQNRYYDSQGIQVAEDSRDITYVVEIDASVECDYPGSNEDSKFHKELQNQLQRLVIRIATSSSTDYDFRGKDPSLYTTFNHYVARVQPLIP